MQPTLKLAADLAAFNDSESILEFWTVGRCRRWKWEAGTSAFNFVWLPMQNNDAGIFSY